jgi:hypothetical protein
MMNRRPQQQIRLDLNNPVFQRQLFNLPKNDQRSILNTLRKLAEMTWQQVYSNHGLKWEAILSQKGPGGNKLYSFRRKGRCRNRWLLLRDLCNPKFDNAITYCNLYSKKIFNFLLDIENIECPLFVLPRSGPFPPLPPPVGFAPAFVRLLLGYYYGPVRLPISVRRSRVPSGFTARTLQPSDQGQIWDLPVPVRKASVRAWGLRPREAKTHLALAMYSVLPSVQVDDVGTPKLTPFRGSIPSPHFACQRFAHHLTGIHA